MTKGELSRLGVLVGCPNDMSPLKAEFSPACQRNRSQRDAEQFFWKKKYNSCYELPMLNVTYQGTGSEFLS